MWEKYLRKTAYCECEWIVFVISEVQRYSICGFTICVYGWKTSITRKYAMYLPGIVAHGPRESRAWRVASGATGTRRDAGAAGRGPSGYCKTQQGCNLATRGDVISSYFPTDITLFNAAVWLGSCDKETTIFVFCFELIESFAIHSHNRPHRKSGT